MAAKSQVERQGEYRRNKRAKGECGWDGCHLIPRDDRYYCYSHNEQFKANKAARLKAKRAVA